MIKVTQTKVTNILQLRDMAILDGKKKDSEIAIWIIARSPHWKDKGYTKIIEEMNNATKTAGNSK